MSSTGAAVALDAGLLSISSLMRLLSGFKPLFWPLCKGHNFPSSGQTRFW